MFEAFEIPGSYVHPLNVFERPGVETACRKQGALKWLR